MSQDGRLQHIVDERVSTWIHDYAPKILGMVLASPVFKVKL